MALDNISYVYEQNWLTIGALKSCRNLMTSKAFLVSSEVILAAVVT